jgi:hypothetical protein
MTSVTEHHASHPNARGHYRKLRLSPQELIASRESNGFSVRREAGMRVMVRLVAHSVR